MITIDEDELVKQTDSARIEMEKRNKLVERFAHFGIKVKETATIRELQDAMEALKQFMEALKQFGDKNA